MVAIKSLPSKAEPGLIGPYLPSLKPLSKIKQISSTNTKTHTKSAHDRYVILIQNTHRDNNILKRYVMII